MKICVPKENKERENRVALTPSVVKQLTTAGYEVCVESGAGLKSYFDDASYQEAGASILADTQKIYADADVILKGTRVDGIYTADPEKDSNATKFDSISFDDVIKKGLNVMDSTAFTLSQENKLPIVVFDMNKEGNLLKICEGKNIGTIVNV